MRPLVQPFLQQLAVPGQPSCITRTISILEALWSQHACILAHFFKSIGKSAYQQTNHIIGTQGGIWEELDAEPEYTIPPFFFILTDSSFCFLRKHKIASFYSLQHSLRQLHLWSCTSFQTTVFATMHCIACPLQFAPFLKAQFEILLHSTNLHYGMQKQDLFFKTFGPFAFLLHSEKAETNIQLWNKSPSAAWHSATRVVFWNLLRNLIALDSWSARGVWGIKCSPWICKITAFIREL